MDIKALRYFVEVVRQQSFTRASETLCVTQPTVSKMLKNIEDELGCVLLNRDGRRLQLTDTGKVVMEHAEAILGEFHHLETSLDDIRSLHRGHLRLGIPPGCGMLMARFISVYRQKFPGVDMTVTEAGGLTVQNAVVSGELDVALTVLPLEEQGHLASLPLFSYPLCVLVPESETWSGHDYVTPEELEAHPLLIYREDFALYPRILELFRRRGIQPQIAVRSGQWDFLAEMVRSGIGVAVLPEPVYRHLDGQRLYCLPFRCDLHLQLGMIWRMDSYLSQCARAWLSCCQSLLNEDHNGKGQ